MTSFNRAFPTFERRLIDLQSTHVLRLAQAIRVLPADVVRSRTPVLPPQLDGDVDGEVPPKKTRQKRGTGAAGTTYLTARRAMEEVRDAVANNEAPNPDAVAKIVKDLGEDAVPRGPQASTATACDVDGAEDVVTSVSNVASKELQERITRLESDLVSAQKRAHEFEVELRYAKQKIVEMGEEKKLTDLRSDERASTNYSNGFIAGMAQHKLQNTPMA